MKNLGFLFIACTALILSAFTPGPEEEKEQFPTIELGMGMPLMDYEMLNIDNEKLSLSSVKQQNGTLVVFSCNTCPFVIQWEDRYDDVSQLANRYGIGTALVNSNEAKRDGDDSFKNMQAHAEEANYRTPYLVDEASKLANAFGAKTTPHVFLFDSENVLVYAGSIDDNSKDKNAVSERYLINALNQLGGGQEITVNQTPAKGCSIKRIK
ncbi:MAG: peroxiredoxin [Chitinophagales bacterium]|jgi:peroxiredoxin